MLSFNSLGTAIHVLQHHEECSSSANGKTVLVKAGTDCQCFSYHLPYALVTQSFHTEFISVVFHKPIANALLVAGANCIPAKATRGPPIFSA